VSGLKIRGVPTESLSTQVIPGEARNLVVGAENEIPHCVRNDRGCAWCIVVLSLGEASSA